MQITLSIYRYNSETVEQPKMQDYTLQIKDNSDPMILDLLLEIKNSQDDSISFRRSCREGVCGSDGLNINGKNMLACISHLSEIPGSKNKIIIRPLPGLPVIRDLVVDMKQFYNQYKKVKPYLINENIPPERERLQTPVNRNKLDGLYECILCGCCSTSCPSFWWNPDKFLGPAALLAASRFVEDSRDTNQKERLNELYDTYSLFKCKTIMNCVDVCPKNLNPTKSINSLRKKLIEN